MGYHYKQIVVFFFHLSVGYPEVIMNSFKTKKTPPQKLTKLNPKSLWTTRRRRGAGRRSMAGPRAARDSLLESPPAFGGD